MDGYIRARVYEEQWGGSVKDYVRYFASNEDIETFRQETGFRVEEEVTPSDELPEG